MIINEQYSINNYSTYKKLVSLPPSSKFILYLLKRNGPLSQKALVKISLLPKRTVVYSLKKLFEEDFVRKINDTKDKRIKFYELIV